MTTETVQYLVDLDIFYRSAKGRNAALQAIPSFLKDGSQHARIYDIEPKKAVLVRAKLNICQGEVK